MPRKRRKFRFGVFFRNIIVPLIVLGSLAYAFWVWNQPQTDALKLKEEIVKIETSHRALVIRHEQTYTSRVGGVFTPLVSEGERVKKGQHIGDFSVDETLVSAEAGNAQSLDPVLIDVDALKDQAQGLYKDLVAALKAKDRVGSSSLKEDLNKLLSRIKQIEILQDDNAFELREAASEVSVLKSASHGQVVEVITNQSGTVSYHFDGFEEALKVDNLFSLAYGQLFNQTMDPRPVSLSGIGQEEPVYKIVNTTTWYLACQVLSEDVSKLEPGLNVKVYMGAEVLEAKVDAHLNDGGQDIVILKMLQPSDQMVTQRLTDIRIVSDEVRAMRIPKEALTHQGGQVGVLGLGKTNKLVFLPVTLIETLADVAIIKPLTFSDGHSILRHAQGYKEGDAFD